MDTLLPTIRQRIVDDVLRVLREWSVLSELHYGEPGVKLEYQRLPACWVWDDMEDSGQDGGSTYGSQDGGWIEFNRFRLSIVVAYEFAESDDPDSQNNINRKGNGLRGALQAQLMADPYRQSLAVTMEPSTKDIHRSTWDGIAFLATTWMIQYVDSVKQPWRQEV